MSNLGPGFSGTSPSSLTSASVAALLEGVPPSTEKKQKKRGSRNSSSAQKKLQQLQQQHVHPVVQGQPAGISRSSSATAAALLNMSNERRLSTSSASGHGFGYPTTTTSTGANISQPLATGISIVAPSHDDTYTAGKFPEPSPAACGKRKMAEIAAAQMLAGVVGGATLGRESFSSGYPPQQKRTSVSGTVASDHDHADTGSFGEAGRLTPPPPPPNEAPNVHATPSAAATTTSNGSQMGSMGLSLQITNPDALNQGSGDFKKRLLNGQSSPLTPWDGQLEALVR